MRIGILGASRIAPHAIVAPAARLGGVEMVAVAARDCERAEAFAARHGFAAAEPSYQALIDRDDLDLVYVALPNSEHCAWTVAALARGHAVLCEKPFAMNAAEARAMVAAAERAGRPLIEAFHYRFHALMDFLLDLVAGGSLGRLIDAEASFHAAIDRSVLTRWDRALGGGALYDLGCYALHALRTLIGAEPAVVSAQAGLEGGIDAWLDADLDFAGLPARLSCSMVAPARSARLSLRFERGAVEVDNYVAPQIGHAVRISDAAGARTLTIDGPPTYDAQLAHVRAVVMAGAAPLTGGADAIATMAAIDALHAAAGRASPPGP